jgi:hypothetical protein
MIMMILLLLLFRTIDHYKMIINTTSLVNSPSFFTVLLHVIVFL